MKRQNSQILNIVNYEIHAKRILRSCVNFKIRRFFSFLFHFLYISSDEKNKIKNKNKNKIFFFFFFFFSLFFSLFSLTFSFGEFIFHFVFFFFFSFFLCFVLFLLFENFQHRKVNIEKYFTFHFLKKQETILKLEKNQKSIRIYVRAEIRKIFFLENEIPKQYFYFTVNFIFFFVHFCRLFLCFF